MIHYVTIGARDLDEGAAFYDAVLGTVGWKRFGTHAGALGYGREGDDDPNGQTIWVVTPFNGESARAGNGIMLAMKAASDAEVRAFYDAALASGGSDEGPPGPRPHYGPDWYAGYVRDPTGNKIAIVRNTPLS
jgi:catechol 2,3-dioxygenase-like lactoylglutathione lyase family enzyme